MPPDVQRALQGDGDDGVHRMAVRVGDPLQPDPAEEQYGDEPGDHVEIARQSLSAGDLARAIYHLGRALAEDPTQTERLALLDQWIIAAGPSALELVPLTDPQYFVTLEAAERLMREGNTPEHRMEAIPIVGQHYHAKVAVHAYIQVSQGQVADGVKLLLNLIRVKPEILYVAWFERWQRLPGLPAALEPQLVLPVAVRIIQQFGGDYIFSAAKRTVIGYYLLLLQMARAAHPDDQVIGGLYSLVLRKVGRFSEAAAIASTLPGSYQTYVALAMAEKAQGHIDAAIAAYQQALRFDVDDVAARNDISSAYVDMGNLAEARRWCEESVRLDPADPFQQAAARLDYIRILQDPSDAAALEDLRRLSQRQRSAMHTLYLLDAEYIGRLPGSYEAIMNLWRGVMERVVRSELTITGEQLKIGLSSLESPSARLALQRSAANYDATITLDAANNAVPDPRLPLRPVTYQLWRYEGTDPIPNVPAPTPTIAGEIARIAQIPFALDRWHGPARDLGRRLGTSAIIDLLGAMAHPPAAPDGWEEWDWIWAVQLAAALTLTAVDDGWEDSQRRKVLTDLAYGPMDWSGAAALMALAVLARQSATYAIAFDALCRDLWQRSPSEGAWALEEAIVAGLIFCEDYSDEAGKLITAYFERKRADAQSAD